MSLDPPSDIPQAARPHLLHSRGLSFTALLTQPGSDEVMCSSVKWPHPGDIEYSKMISFTQA